MAKKEIQVKLIGVDAKGNKAKFGKDVAWYQAPNPGGDKTYFQVFGFDQGKVIMRTKKGSYPMQYDEANNCWRVEINTQKKGLIKARLTRKKIVSTLTYWA